MGSVDVNSNDGVQLRVGSGRGSTGPTSLFSWLHWVPIEELSCLHSAWTSRRRWRPDCTGPAAGMERQRGSPAVTTGSEAESLAGAGTALTETLTPLPLGAKQGNSVNVYRAVGKGCVDPHPELVHPLSFLILFFSLAKLHASPTG